MMAKQTSKDWCSGGQEECKDFTMRIPEAEGDRKNGWKDETDKSVD